MPWNATSTQIAEALRTADAPSREIDDRIWRWVNEKQWGVKGWRYDLEEAPRYTESVDAALTLLPLCDTGERFDYVLEHINGGLTIGCQVGTNDPDAVVFGCNDASAISRACLVAHHREFGR
ncbi:hypothetical protein BES08_07220 [Novosphingobium resinovorum]|uniref:Phage ABA sandwich domain-containing protein n=1 Tax=Novosphingobium resinovorum TaxID=158500 RepID=A0A1D8A3B9_9SPHN|nr:hypothetical protein BES08_07220 [Novosphingobium resinovorum]